MAGQPGSFRTAGVGVDVVLSPFYRLHRRVYTAYWDLAHAGREHRPAEGDRGGAGARAPARSGDDHVPGAGREAADRAHNQQGESTSVVRTEAARAGGPPSGSPTTCRSPAARQPRWSSPTTVTTAAPGASRSSSMASASRKSASRSTASRASTMRGRAAAGARPGQSAAHGPLPGAGGQRNRARLRPAPGSRWWRPRPGALTRGGGGRRHRRNASVTRPSAMPRSTSSRNSMRHCAASVRRAGAAGSRPSQQRGGARDQQHARGDRHETRRLAPRADRPARHVRA